MKKLIGLLCILFILTLLVPPKQAAAHGVGRGGGGGFLPGLVVGGVLGWSLAPRYYAPPAYYYPPPVYYYPNPVYYHSPPAYYYPNYYSPSGSYGYQGNHHNSYNQGYGDGSMMH